MNLTKPLTAAAAALATAGLLAAPAQAREPLDTTTVSGDDCVDRGITNYYVHSGDDVDPVAIHNAGFVFQTHRCDVNGFRLYKSNSDTLAELNFARQFLIDAAEDSWKPMVFCRTSETTAYFLDLAKVWGLWNITELNEAEMTQYADWTHEYAQRHGCRTIEPLAGKRPAAKRTLTVG